MTTIKIITKTEYNEKYRDEIGSLMFPNNYHNVLPYCDLKKLKKNLPPLPKGARILHVIIHTESSPNYKNIANPLVPYKTPLCADFYDDGAYYYTSSNGFSMWAVDNPQGDVIVVVNKPL